jgi:MerR family mercuric resistance operon transcriptional regulator
MARRTISKLAKQVGVGVETIRFYERLGIVAKPAIPASGWREYDDATLETVRYIKQGQQLGFTLNEIKRMQKAARGDQGSFCESVRAATRQKIAAVEHEIEELRDRQQQLKDFLTRCSAKIADEKCPLYQAIGAMTKMTKRKSQ